MSAPILVVVDANSIWEISSSAAIAPVRRIRKIEGFADPLLFPLRTNESGVVLLDVPTSSLPDESMRAASEAATLNLKSLSPVPPPNRMLPPGTPAPPWTVIA